LFDNGSGDRGANATAATIANGQDVDGILHGLRKRWGNEKMFRRSQLAAHPIVFPSKSDVLQ
jgi:hypothetical protein